MPKMLLFLLTLCVLLAGAITSIKVLPRFISFQDPINPRTLINDYDPNAVLAIFNNQKITVPQDEPRVLGESDNKTNANKYIEVDLASQMLYAYENGKRIYEFVISSGKWDRTPNGTFKIWTKIRSQKMSGGSKATGDYYYLPNVPYIMFFYNSAHPKSAGFSLHGTYWHNNFGVPMSHGCINMKTADAATMFNWSEVGTEIRIYGKWSGKKKG